MSQSLPLGVKLTDEVPERQLMNRRHADPELRRLLESADSGQRVSLVCSLRLSSASPPEPGEPQRQVMA